MPNLYNNYCYSTLDDAAIAEIAGPVFDVNVGAAVATAYSKTSATGVDLTFTYRPFSSDVSSNYVIARNYPTCENVGLNTNYSGLSLSDVQSVTWQVVLCFVVAFAIKTIIRTMPR